jgi:hypothetical protein
VTSKKVLLLSVLLLGSATLVRAQGVSPYFGLGSATNGAGTSARCPAGYLFDSFTGLCEPGPIIGGLFGVFGADFMFKPHLGINGEYAFRFAQADYLPAAGLKFRPGFYDVNAVWEPGPGKRIAPFLEGGIGSARVALYITQQCTITGINCTATYPAGFNGNHFQVHAGLGLKLYIQRSLFIKPQVDFHYVIHLTDQFGSDWVPQYTASVGYTFGKR